MDQLPFNQRFKKLLQHYDITSSEAARRMNVGRQTTDSYLKDSLPGLKAIQMILHAFPEVQIEWLVLGKGEMLKGFDNVVQESAADYGGYIKKSDYERLEKVFDAMQKEHEKIFKVMQEELEACREELKLYRGTTKSKTG
jgi:hypothetical protein